METKKVKVNGIEMAYARRGAGKPLVLIHGFPFDHTAWNDVIPYLEGSFDLILPDLRGFGESGAPESPYTMSDMADDLAGLLDHLGIEKSAIAGHSMGGYAALAFAKKHPERVSALGLVSSQAAADTPERKEGRYKTARDVEDKGVEVVAEAMTPKFSASEKVQEVVRGMIMKQGRAGVSGALQAMAEREDSTPVLASFDFPLVLIHGDADALIPLEKSQEIKSAAPAAELTILAGAGHMPMLEFPRETAAALKKLG
jgi:pimeloyl-ACP methyl ester carboxylesterase